VKLVCVTRGHRGSLLVCGDKKNEHPGFTVKVADTVGAGTPLRLRWFIIGCGMRRWKK